jgi:hypothetical protein
MAFNYKTGLADTVNLINPEVYITNHHPVIYTLLIGACVRIAGVLGASDNFGIFILAFVQYIINAFVMAYICTYCGRNLKKEKLAVFAVLFYIFCPWIQKYIIMISKDTFFADLVILFVIVIHQAISDKLTVRKQIELILIAFGLVLFRKNGLYVAVLTFVLLAAYFGRKQWKSWLVCLIAVMLFSAGYSNIILPLAQITDGSPREALCVPFQQTARYVSRHEDEVTDEEKVAIDNVLQYDTLKESYSGTFADHVKNTYRKEAGKDDLMEYFKVWFKMFFKHPETYIAATLNNYYAYFYPVVNDELKLYRTSVGSMANANRDGYFNFENINDDLHRWLRDIVTLYDKVWMGMPGLNLLMTSAFYVWIPVIGFYLKWIRKDKAGMAGIFATLVLILTALAGPCNAINYERYIFPCILGLPVIIAIALSDRSSYSKT